MTRAEAARHGCDPGAELQDWIIALDRQPIDEFRVEWKVLQLVTEGRCIDRKSVV